MTNPNFTHIGEVGFKERDLLLGLARWQPKEPGIDTVVPMQQFIIANAGINITVQQLVARHKDFQGGRWVLFADQVTVGRDAFIQFLIKPLMYPMMLRAMNGDVEHLRNAFDIIVRSGAATMIVQDSTKLMPKGPKLGVAFRD